MRRNTVRNSEGYISAVQDIGVSKNARTERSKQTVGADHLLASPFGVSWAFLRVRPNYERITEFGQQEITPLQPSGHYRQHVTLIVRSDHTG